MSGTLPRILTLLLLLGCPLYAAAQAPASAAPITNADIIKLIHAGLPEAAIINRIRANPGAFDISTDALIALKKAGATDAELAAITVPSTAPQTTPPQATVTQSATAMTTQATTAPPGTLDPAKLDLATLEQQANAGDAAAEAELGSRFLLGRGGAAKDYAQALLWSQKAAAQGNATAEATLGDIYQGGFGTPQDYAQGILWYRKAADQNDAHAEMSLSIAYHFAWGVAQDEAQSVAWCVKAAMQGDLFCESHLGDVYAQGLGVPQDFEQAIFWYSKAVAAGMTADQPKLAAIVAHMQPSQPAKPR